MATTNNDFKVKHGLSVATSATVRGTTQSNSTTTGALKVLGGVGIGRNLNVGGSLNVQNTFTVNSNLIIENSAIIHNQSGVSVSTSTTILDSFSIDMYRSAKYIISISNSLQSEFQTTEVLLVQSGSDSFIQETSVFSGNTSLMSYSTTVTDQTVVLYGAGRYDDNQIKVQKVYITI